MINDKIIQGLMRIDRLSEEELYELIKFDLDNGIYIFDLADCYGNGLVEEKLGNVLRMHPELRQNMFIQTKCSVTRSDVGTYYDLSYDHIVEAVNASLERMGIDYIDSLLLHRADVFIDKEEIDKVFSELKESGKVKHFGVSNFSSSLIEYLNQDIEVNQLQFGLGHLKLVEDVFNYNTKEANSTNSDFFYYKKKGIKLQAWSPFQIGYFGGPIFDLNEYPQLNEKLDELAKKYNSTRCGIATAFVTNLWDKISLVTGSTNQEHIKESIDGSKIKLEKKDWYSLYKAAGKMLP